MEKRLPFDGSDYKNVECCPAAVAVSFVEGGYLK